MTTLTTTAPTTLAQAFERAIHGAAERAAQRAAGVVMRTDRMPPIDVSPARVVFRADEHPTIEDRAPERIDWFSPGTTLALADIGTERLRQEEKYPGTTCAALDMTPTDKLTILVAEVGEAAEEAKMLRWPRTIPARIGGHALGRDAEIRARLRNELVQVGAICTAWIEALDSEIEADASRQVVS